MDRPGLWWCRNPIPVSDGRRRASARESGVRLTTVPPASGLQEAETIRMEEI